MINTRIGDGRLELVDLTVGEHALLQISTCLAFKALCDLLLLPILEEYAVSIGLVSLHPGGFLTDRFTFLALDLLMQLGEV